MRSYITSQQILIWLNEKNIKMKGLTLSLKGMKIGKPESNYLEYQKTLRDCKLFLPFLFNYDDSVELPRKIHRCSWLAQFQRKDEIIIENSFQFGPIKFKIPVVSKNKVGGLHLFYITDASTSRIDFQNQINVEVALLQSRFKVDQINVIDAVDKTWLIYDVSKIDFQPLLEEVEKAILSWKQKRIQVKMQWASYREHIFKSDLGTQFKPNTIFELFEYLKQKPFWITRDNWLNSDDIIDVSQTDRETRTRKQIVTVENVKPIIWKNVDQIKNGPIQIFLSQNMIGQLKKQPKMIDNLKIMMRKRRIYIHADYIVNLSKLNGKNLHMVESWLIYANKLNARGLVIHVGKACNDTEQNALDEMHKFVKALLPKIRINCPLIIETPAGQGTEILITPESLANFLNAYDDRIKLCIDTCHVFASGYQPVDYLNRIVQLAGDKLMLFHLNDSRKPFASHLDRHYSPANGYIELNQLTEIIKFANKRGISLIRE